MNLREEEGVLQGTTRYFGVVHDWQERPWEWVRNRSGTVVRIYSRGFPLVMRAVLEVEPGEKTGLRVYFGWIPRSRLATPGLWAMNRYLGRSYRAMASALEEAAGRPPTERPVLVRPGRELEGEVVSRIASLCRDLESLGVPGELVRRLSEIAGGGDPLELHRLRLGTLAVRWDVDRRQLLVALLQATRLGLFELRWDTVCPPLPGGPGHGGQPSRAADFGPMRAVPGRVRNGRTRGGGDHVSGEPVDPASSRAVLLQRRAGPSAPHRRPALGAGRGSPVGDPGAGGGAIPAQAHRGGTPSRDPGGHWSLPEPGFVGRCRRGDDGKPGRSEADQREWGSVEIRPGGRLPEGRCPSSRGALQPPGL